MLLALLFLRMFDAMRWKEFPPRSQMKREPRFRREFDDAVYGLMMVIDGVTGGISNANHNLYIDFVVRLAKRVASIDDELVSEVDLRQGDGMCMGYDGWLEGDFGTDAVAVPRRLG
jgi:hypothetical protein